MLRNENFLGDCGTFASNAFTTGNSNALEDVLGENYDMIREFFQTETDAFICSATMTYLDDVSDQAKEHSVPEGLKDASLPEKRQWFYEQVYSLLDSFVMDSVDSLKDESQDEEEVVKCCDPSCNHTFKYRKCRTCMSRPHTIYLLTQKPEDSIFDYGCLHLRLGLVVRDAEDAVKEGDGDRLMRVWTFLTLLFCLNGANKYALGGLRVQASILGLFTPKDAHRIKWNCFAGLLERPGRKISRDLRLEQYNKVAKGDIRAMGIQNINDKSAIITLKSSFHCLEFLKRLAKDNIYHVAV